MRVQPDDEPARHSGAVAGDDARLIAAARRDPQRFTAVYDRYGDRVFRYALAQTGSRYAAEDIVSETMLAALESLDRYDPARGSVAAWLFTIASHKAADHRRLRHKLWRAITRHDPAERPQVDPLEEVLHQEVVAQLRAAIRDLSAADRQVVLLRYSAELTSAEIGQLLGISPGAARTRLSRALQRLSALVGVLDG